MEKREGGGFSEVHLLALETNSTTKDELKQRIITNKQVHGMRDISDAPGVFFEAVAVGGGGADVEGIRGRIYLQSLSQAPVPLQRSTFLVTFKPDRQQTVAYTRANLLSKNPSNANL